MRTRPAASRDIFEMLVTALAAAMLFGLANAASAQSIARALQSGPAYLCPKVSCPQASRGAPRAGAGVAVFEISGGFARITGYMDTATAGAKYGMTSLPQGGSPVALWIPIDRLALAPSVAKKIEADKQAEEERLKREAEKKRAAERHRQKELAEKKRKVEEAETAKAAKADESRKPVADKVAKKVETSTKAKVDSKPATAASRAETASKTDVKPKPAGKAGGEALAAKPAEPEEPVKPKPAAPRSLTAALKDQRLSTLPSKAGPTLTMADVVAIRQKGLELLEAGECETLSAGGVASTAGFLFVQCSGVSMGSGFTQFPRPAQ